MAAYVPRRPGRTLVEVGDLVVRDVAAVVLPDEALSDNLLGFSFLSPLGRFE
jgi:aspartyl protease family protein